MRFVAFEALNEEKKRKKYKIEEIFKDWTFKPHRNAILCSPSCVSSFCIKNRKLISVRVSKIEQFVIHSACRVRGLARLPPVMDKLPGDKGSGSSADGSSFVLELQLSA